MRHLVVTLRSQDRSKCARRVDDGRAEPARFHETSIAPRSGARFPDHPKAAEAKETLAQYLELDEILGRTETMAGKGE